MNPQHKAQIIADFEREEEVRAASSSTKRKSQAQNAKDGYYFNKVTTEKIPLNSSTNESAYTAPLSAGEPTQIQDEPSSSQPLALVVKSSRMKRGGSLPEVYSSMAQQRPRTDSIAMPTAPTLEQPRHPNKPKVTPEKSFKGPASSNKPQKQNHWETIPFDAEKSPSDSNRSKRSRSIPASSPDNLLGQELVDNYLTLRNRQLGALPSSPLGRPPRSSVHEDGIAFTPGVSSEMDNSPCKPATGFGKQHQSSSRLRKNGDASKEAGLGLDGAGDARKRKSDMSVASESTPTRSSKRKRPSSGSSNAPLGAGENYSMQPAKITKRTSMNSKDNEGSGDKVAQVKQGPSLHTMAMNDFHSENLIDAQNAQEQFVTSRPQEQINKKQRRHSRAMSARELSSVLTPHKPAMGVNTSFGASFAQASSTRSTRNPTTRQEKVANETKAESSQAKSLKVTATYKMPMLFMKGVESLTQETMTRGLAKNTIANSTNTTSEPASHADDSEKAESGTIKGRSARVKQPEKNVSKMVKRKQKDAEALITPANIAKESPNTQEQQMMTMRPNTKVQSAPQNGDEYVEKAEVSSSMNTKPKIDPGIASADSSRRYQKSSREAKTLTPSSVNLATMEHIKTPNTLLHTVSSSATMKETPGSTIFFREVPTPTMSFPVTQGGVEPPKPATREPLFPPLNTVSTPCSTSGPAATATATTTGSVNSTVKEQHPLNLSVSADLAWKPNSICADSVLSYATEKMATNWSGKEYVLQSGCVYRGTKAEREAVFRASGILMGVRFVLGVSQDQGGDVVA